MLTTSGVAQLGLVAFANERIALEVRGGLSFRQMADSDEVGLEWRGAAPSFDVPGDSWSNGGYAGGEIPYAIKDRVDLIANIGISKASGKENSTSGQLQLEIKL